MSPTQPQPTAIAKNGVERIKAICPFRQTAVLFWDGVLLSPVPHDLSGIHETGGAGGGFNGEMNLFVQIAIGRKIQEKTLSEGGLPCKSQKERALVSVVQQPVS